MQSTKDTKYIFIALKVSFSGKKNFSVQWKVSKFLHAASFAVTRKKLMLANFRLKIRAV